MSRVQVRKREQELQLKYIFLWVVLPSAMNLGLLELETKSTKSTEMSICLFLSQQPQFLVLSIFSQRERQVLLRVTPWAKNNGWETVNRREWKPWGWQFKRKGKWNSEKCPRGFQGLNATSIMQWSLLLFCSFFFLLSDSPPVVDVEADKRSSTTNLRQAARAFFFFC